MPFIGGDKEFSLVKGKKVTLSLLDEGGSEERASERQKDEQNAFLP